MAQMSPVTYINAGDPPILTFHGTKDLIVPLEQGKLLHAALKKAGVNEKLVEIEGGGHGFDPVTMAVTSTQAFQFFDEQFLGKKPAAAAPGDAKK
jgi:dipeptidyl aminopeptidase/acylaminoacyl peptidase